MASTTDFTPRDLALLRQVHLARLSTARRVDRRTGEAIGAPGTLISLGTYLYAAGAIDTLAEAEAEFGMTLDWYDWSANPAVQTDRFDEGQRFAAVILDDLRAGGTGLTVRCPVAPESGHARYNRKLMGPAFDRRAA